jgi:hypothetical protein
MMELLACGATFPQAAFNAVGMQACLLAAPAVRDMTLQQCVSRGAVRKAYLMPLTSRYSSCRGKGGCSLKALGSGALNTSEGLCRHNGHALSVRAGSRDHVWW